MLSQARRRDSGRHPLAPGGPMQNEENQPANKCYQTAWNSEEHEPAHYTERIKELAVIVSVDDAWMHRAFIHFASVCIRDRAAQHHGSNRRKRERHDDEQRQQIPKPWKSFMWVAVHKRDSK